MENFESDINSNILKVIIAYHEILAEEIQRRSRDQMFCVTASMGIIGTSIPITLQFPMYSFIIAGVPWILAAFGVIWFDHHHAIAIIGKYKREVEEKYIPLLGSLPQETKWMGWEVYKPKIRDEYLRSMNKLQKFILNYAVFFPLLYFIIPALFSCIYFIHLCYHGYIMLPTVIKISFILIDLFCVHILLSYYYYHIIPDQLRR